MQAVQAAQASLDELDALPPLGTDAVRHNWKSVCDMTSAFWFIVDGDIT